MIDLVIIEYGYRRKISVNVIIEQKGLLQGYNAD